MTLKEFLDKTIRNEEFILDLLFFGGGVFLALLIKSIVHAVWINIM